MAGYLCSIVVKEGWEIEVKDENGNTIEDAEETSYMMREFKHKPCREDRDRNPSFGRPFFWINDQKYCNRDTRIKTFLKINENWQIIVTDGNGDQPENLKVQIYEDVQNENEDWCITVMGRRICF